MNKQITLAVLFLILAGAGYDDILIDKNMQLENIRKEITDSKRRITENKGVIRSLERLSDSLNTELDALSKFLQDYENERFLTALEIAEESSIVMRLEEDVREIQASFLNKIVSLYKHGKNYELELLLSSKTPNEFLKRGQYLQKFSQTRARELKELRTKRYILEEKKKLLNQSTSSKRIYIESKRNQRTKLSSRADEMKNAIIELDEEIKRDELIVELREREQSNVKSYLENFIENKSTFKGEKASRINYTAETFEELKGMMNLPVELDLVRRGFGEYTDNATSTVSYNNGIDFSIARNSKVYCTVNGKIEASEELPYYGKIIIINHGSGYRTVYAVLGEVLVETGGSVRPNQLLGRTGENIEGQTFHFEIWRDKTALNPGEWLRFPK